MMCLIRPASGFLYSLILSVAFVENAFALEAEPFRCRSEKWYSPTISQENRHETALNRYMEEQLNGVLRSKKNWSCSASDTHALGLRVFEGMRSKEWDTSGLLKYLGEKVWSTITAAGLRKHLLYGAIEQFVQTDKQIMRCEVPFLCSTYFQYAYLDDFKGVSLSQEKQDIVDEKRSLWCQPKPNGVSSRGEPPSELDLSSDGALRSRFVHSVIKICGQYVGADKFSHFIDEGWTYWGKFDGSNIDEVLDIGMQEEKGLFGKQSSYMISHADLAANFSGLAFFNQLYSKYPYGAGAGAVPKAPNGATQPRSFFACEGNKIVRTTKKFNWCDYINPGWDEAINCFVPGDTHHSWYVRKNMALFGEADKMDYKCPMDPKMLEDAKDKMTPLFHSLGIKNPDKYWSKILNLDKKLSPPTIERLRSQGARTTK